MKKPVLSLILLLGSIVAASAQEDKAKLDALFDGETSKGGVAVNAVTPSGRPQSALESLRPFDHKNDGTFGGDKAVQNLSKAVASDASSKTTLKDRLNGAGERLGDGIYDGGGAGFHYGSFGLFRHDNFFGDELRYDRDGSIMVLFPAVIAAFALGCIGAVVGFVVGVAAEAVKKGSTWNWPNAFKKEYKDGL